MYIRTKDGVYEIDENTKGTEDFLWVKTNKANIVQCVWLNCITKQADTIEELCDEFVLYDNQLKTYGVFDKKVITFKWIQNHSTIYKGMTIYGAIWTSKGLIYVAKMDNEGKLVLI